MQLFVFEGGIVVTAFFSWYRRKVFNLEKKITLLLKVKCVIAAPLTMVQN